MNRNNGRKIAVRLFALRDFLFANADKTHAVRIEEKTRGRLMRKRYAERQVIRVQQTGLDSARQKQNCHRLNDGDQRRSVKLLGVQQKIDEFQELPGNCDDSFLLAELGTMDPEPVMER